MHPFQIALKLLPIKWAFTWEISDRFETHAGLSSVRCVVKSLRVFTWVRWTETQGRPEIRFGFSNRFEISSHRQIVIWAQFFETGANWARKIKTELHPGKELLNKIICENAALLLVLLHLNSSRFEFCVWMRWKIAQPKLTQAGVSFK